MAALFRHREGLGLGMPPAYSSPGAAADGLARSLIEAHIDPFFILSLDGTITDVNRAAEAVAGLPRRSLIGTRFAGHFADAHAAQEGLSRVLREGAIRDHPFVLRRPDGSLVDLECSATIRREDSGEVLGVFVAGRDVTR